MGGPRPGRSSCRAAWSPAVIVPAGMRHWTSTPERSWSPLRTPQSPRRLPGSANHRTPQQEQPAWKHRTCTATWIMCS
ncbi:hypothetical protein ACFFX0_17600 [Citricoccus parietis]|uniref:Uncharacterized protein n=1 Tax=Citricoccus parietis TaxID=592307 RepID=A0ABV5G1V4_9MICC